MKGPDKRYLVFGSDLHDSVGGLCSLQDSFDDLQLAKDYTKTNKEYDYYEIYDRVEGLEINI